MSCGGVYAEWMVRCDACAIDVEPGRWYDTQSEAMSVRNRAVKHESWLLTAKAELICPECAGQPATALPARSGPSSPSRPW
jgi:hypothetical protein